MARLSKVTALFITVVSIIEMEKLMRKHYFFITEFFKSPSVPQKVFICCL
jgi:hypothetical protein